MSITISYKKFGLIPMATTWFNKSLTFDANELSLIHTFRQSEAKLDISQATCIKQSVFTTTVIGLSLPEEDLLKNCAPKSCRYEIRKVQKMIDAGEDVKIKKNSDIEQFVKIANNYIKIKKYAKPLKAWFLQQCIEQQKGELINIYYNGQLAGGNFYIKDHPDRVRLLCSFNDRFADKELQKKSGAFMRYLHWEAIIKYKAEGFVFYDFGGVVLEKDSPIYGITQFKLSFGGALREEYDLIFVRNPLISSIYKLYRSIH